MAIKCHHSDHPPPDEKLDSKKGSKDDQGSSSSEDISTYDLTLLKHDWFEKDPQTNKCGTVTVHLYVKQINEDQVDIQLSENKLQVKFATSNKEFLKMYQGTSMNTLFSWKMTLKGKVDVASSTCKIRKAFLEVNLVKKSPGRWGALEMPVFPGAVPKAASGKEVYRNILKGNQTKACSIPNGTASWLSDKIRDSSKGQEAPLPSLNGEMDLGSDHINSDTITNKNLNGGSSDETLKFEEGASSSSYQEEEILHPIKEPSTTTTAHRNAIPTEAFPTVPPPPPEPPTASCSAVKAGVMGGSKFNCEQHVPFDEAIRKAANKEADVEVLVSSEEEANVMSPGFIGYTGLENLRNTCYLNSILQCLANTRQLRDFFLGGDYKNDINTDNPLGTGGKLAAVFASLMRNLWSGKERYLAPHKIKSIVGDKVCQFKGFMQQDAQEFMAFFLDGLHEDLNRIVTKPYTNEIEGAGRPDAEVANEAWKLYKSRNDSIIVDLFQGQLKSKLTCPECKKISIKYDPFMNLSVPLPKEQTLLTVYVFFKEPKKIPVKVIVRVCIKPSLEQLQAAIQKKLEILPENMRIFEAYRGKMKEFERGCSLSSVLPSDVIVCSEVLSEEEAGEEVCEIPVIQRTLFPSSVPVECANCHKNNQQLKRCQQCWNVGYCNRECQKAHWCCHKRSCQRTNYQAVGVPFFLSLPASKATFRRLQEMAEEYAKYSVDVQIGVNTDGRETQGEASEAESCSTAGRSQECFASSQDSASSDASGQLKETRFYFKPVNIDGEGIKKDARLADQGDTPLDLSDVRLAMDWRNDPRMPGHVVVKSKHVIYREHSSCHTETLPDTYSCTLQECLELFTEPETLSENDAWYCPECKAHRQATKQMSVWRLPEILIIHLKRFSFRNILFKDKISKLVDFPIRGLDMSPFTLGKGHIGEKDIYDLFAVTNHSGTVNFGHYTAFARLSKSSCADVNGLSKNTGIRWRYFDDRSVSDAMEHRVVSKYAYVLFYRRRPKSSTEQIPFRETYPEHPAVPQASSVTSQEPEEKRASLEDVDENELD